MPKQPQQLSWWSANTTRAYSTNPSSPQENDGSEKPAEKEAADGDNNNNNSSETTTTTTTTSSTNTETSQAHDLVSEAQKRAERTKQLLDSLRIKSPISASGTSNPPTNLKKSLKGLTKGLRELNAKPNDPVLARDFTKSIVPEIETKQADEQASSLRTVANRISPILDRKPKPMIKTVPMKLGPKLGRQIMVQNDRGMDCASAIRTLEVSCRSNNLRRQEANQRFHVRRGQARKNLRIQRWRKLFKVSFLATVKKIDRMRDQGW
jgi:hypothetical protein